MEPPDSVNAHVPRDPQTSMRWAAALLTCYVLAIASFLAITIEAGHTHLGSIPRLSLTTVVYIALIVGLWRGRPWSWWIAVILGTAWWLFTVTGVVVVTLGGLKRQSLPIAAWFPFYLEPVLLGACLTLLLRAGRPPADRAAA